MKSSDEMSVSLFSALLVVMTCSERSCRVFAGARAPRGVRVGGGSAGACSHEANDTPLDHSDFQTCLLNTGNAVEDPNDHLHESHPKAPKAAPCEDRTRQHRLCRDDHCQQHGHPQLGVATSLPHHCNSLNSFFQFDAAMSSLEGRSGRQADALWKVHGPGYRVVRSKNVFVYSYCGASHDTNYCRDRTGMNLEIIKTGHNPNSRAAVFDAYTKTVVPWKHSALVRNPGRVRHARGRALHHARD